MRQSFQKFDELRELLNALCEETITAPQMKHLEGLVLSHPEAEAYYVQYMNLYADLAGHFTGLPGLREQYLRGRGTGEQPPGDSETRRREGRRSGDFVASLSSIVRPGRRGRFLFWGSLGVAGLAASVFLALAWLHRPAQSVATGPKPDAEQVDNSIAVLLQSHEAAWEETGLPTRPGAPLPPGRLRLKSGFAQVEFYSGATVILEGPADFQLISPKEAYCARGRLRATVPAQAQGFTIGSPQCDLVDRGTEFGLRVGLGDKTEVHVFHGKVELYDAGSLHETAAHKELTTGQGVRLDGPGQVSPIHSDPAAFSTVQDLAERQEAETRRRQRLWNAASDTVRQDPSLAVYFPFQPDHAWVRTLLDQRVGRQQPHDGAIVGCTWVTGRWSGKQGLEFKRVSDRVRFHVPGEFESLTLGAWVRVDALPNRFNSLMMTDGWEDGAPHWHISNSGKLELGVHGSKQQGLAHYLTGEVLTPERLGQWVHLAVVYDRDAHLVTHYVDGKSVAQEPIELDIPLRLGDVEIGNWNLGNRVREKSPVRYFNGCIDEFMLFSRALSEEEIGRLYSQGRPPL
jgi:hypothetical protein